MDIAKLKERFKKMTDVELEHYICDLETTRLTLIDIKGRWHPSVNEVNIEMDTIAGEMIRRDNLKKNSSTPKAETPKAPDTFYQLMCLGDGSIGDNK